MKFKIFMVLILFTVLSVSISKADLASIPPEKELKIAQHFLENVKTFVKLYPDEFDIIKIVEFILTTRPIIDGTLDDKLKEELKLFIEFTNKSNQFAKYQDEIEKNIKNGLSHKKAIAAVKKEEKKEVVKKEEKKEKKEEKKEEKINKSNIKNKNDLSKYLIENGLVYINNDGSTAKFIFSKNGKGTHENRIKKIGITWKVENKNIFMWQDTEFLKQGIRFASVTLDFDSDLINMVLSDGANYMFKIKIKEEKINKSNIKNKNDLSKYLIQNGLRYTSDDGTDRILTFFSNGEGTYYMDNKKKEFPLIWETVNENTFKSGNPKIIEQKGWTIITLDFDKDSMHLDLSAINGKEFNYKIKKNN